MPKTEHSHAGVKGGAPGHEPLPPLRALLRIILAVDHPHVFWDIDRDIDRNYGQVSGR